MRYRKNLGKEGNVVEDGRKYPGWEADQEFLRKQRENVPEWYVTAGGSFFTPNRREHPGIPLPFAGDFSIGENRFRVLGVYSCGKGLAVDLCRELDPKAFQAYLEKWGLPLDADYRDLETRFGPGALLQIEVENPFRLEFEISASVNGKESPGSESISRVYLPGIEGPWEDVEAHWLLSHYGLEKSKGWEIARYVFPWSRRREVETLSLTVKEAGKELPGTPFQVRAGERVALRHPVTGRMVTLTALEVKEKTLDMEAPFPELGNWEFPQCFQRLVYTLDPESGEEETITLRDAAPMDRPRTRDGGAARFPGAWGYIDGEPVPEASSIGVLGEADGPTATVAGAGPEAVSICIIGGADGPTAVFLAEKREPQTCAAYSSLRFQPVESVTWVPVFPQPGAADLTVELGRTE